MVKRMVKFPLKMKNGAEVRTLEELLENADAESLMEYYFSGHLSRWCKVNNIEGFPENLIESTNVPEIELAEEELITDDSLLKEKIRLYLDEKVNIDNYEIEIVPAKEPDGTVCEYCVKVSNKYTDQYYRFVVPVDSVKKHIDIQQFENDLHRMTARTVEFLELNNSFNQNYVYLDKGDTFKFGSYNGNLLEWKVLRRDINGIYAVTCSEICSRSFRDDWEAEDANVWEKSDLRQWLNGDFYNSAFSETEKGMIKSVESDMVTLLTKEEVEILMTDEERTSDSWWWLRSGYPAGFRDSWREELFVLSVLAERSTFSPVDRVEGVRPALNLKF